MGPKNKDKKQKKKKEAKPPKPLKSEYLAKIAERNAVLAAARKRIQGVEDIYFDTEKRYDQTQEDMTDIIKYLQHEIEENELEIAAFDEKIAECTIEIQKTNKYFEAIFAKMEEEYEEKEKALNYQIQQNTAKLSGLEEVRRQREEYLKKKELLNQKIHGMEARHREEIYVAEKQAIIKQDTMQKEMEFHLTKLATDFRQASDIAIGETTNKLIRDNIKLGNMLTCMQEVFENARDAYHKVYQTEKRYRYNAGLLEEEQYMIFQKYTQQVENIETKLKSHEELHERIKMSEKLIKDNRRLQRQIAEKECILREKVGELNDLQRELNENEEVFSLVKNAFNTLRRQVVNLEFTLYEAAKCVKQGLDIEAITRILDEKGDDLLQEVPKDEQEETLKEYKFKARETEIEKAIEKLRKGLLFEPDTQLAALSSDSYLAGFRESTQSDIRHLKSNDEIIDQNNR